MSGLIFGSQNTNAAKPTKYTSLSVQTSVLDKPITIFWGRARLVPNLIWYNDFTAHKHKQGGKGGGSGSGTKTYTYTVAVAMALCEGPIQSIATVYQNQSTTTLAKLGLTLYLGTTTQTPPGYIITKHPTQALSYARTAYLFASKYDLGSSQTLPQHWFETIGNLSGTMPGTDDANFADIINDLLSNTQYGLDSANIALDPTTWSLYKTYCQAQGIFVSPVLETQETCVSVFDRWAQISNTWIFWSGDKLKFVPLGDSAITANGVTYTPVTDVRYDLTVNDFIDQTQPIKVVRADPADANNRIVFEIENRANKYNTYPCEYKDQTLIDKYGLRDASSVTAHEIKDIAIGNIAVSLYGKRQAYQRNTYQFTLPYRFLLLEPGDIVQITDPNNEAITHLPVRITKVEEDENQNLAFEAEEFTGVVGTISAYTPGSNTPDDVNHLVDPGDVNPPAIFEPNSTLTSGVAQVWIAASGGQYWGSADVYISFDNVSYSFIGDITSPALQGVLTANLASHADPDTTNTLAVDLTQSVGQMPAVTTADADALRTLSLVCPQPVSSVIQTAGAELLAYGSVTATGTYTDNLTYLRRGKYGTSPGSHSTGDQFTVIDLTEAAGTTLIYNLPAQYIGQTLYFKFVSTNQFGLSPQDISTVTAYQYVPTGAGYGGGTGGVPATPTGLTATGGSGQITVNWNANSSSDNVTAYLLYAVNGPSGSFGSASLIWQGVATSFTESGLGNGVTRTYFLIAKNGAGNSAHTAGVDGTTAAASFRLQIRGGTPGRKPNNLEELFNITMKAGDKLTSGLPGSLISCEIAPTANWTMTLKKNGTSIGSGTVLAGATTGTWTFSSTVTFADGDVLTLTAPASDSTMSGISYTIIASATT